MKERVSIYIDGFNFYYEAIKGKDRRYYYPSLVGLCTIILDSMKLDYELNEIHYFTAKVKADPKDPTKKRRQTNYTNALKKEGIFLHLGQFSRKFGQPKEKQTDVNIAVQMLNDAWHNRYDHGVLLSNDSDFVQLLRTVREDRKKKVSVWTPGQKSPQSRLLAENADYSKRIKSEYIQQIRQIANKGFQRRMGNS